MTFQTTEEAAKAILRIVEEEAGRLGLAPNLEKSEVQGRANLVIVSLKQNDQVFRIRFNYVRDELLSHYGPGLGYGYIQPEWDLELESVVPEGCAQPLCWRLTQNRRVTSSIPHPDTLEEAWLRRLIRKKLALVHDS